MNACEVCKKETDICCPSPFLPYSGWRCNDCIKFHRIPYSDLMSILHGGPSSTASSYAERLQEFRVWWRGSDGQGPDNGIEYAEKYWIPTMEFFNKDPEQAWKEAKYGEKIDSFS